MILQVTAPELGMKLPILNPQWQKKQIPYMFTIRFVPPTGSGLQKDEEALK